MKNFLLNLFLLITYFGISQDVAKPNIYLDENLQQVSQSEYLDKKWKPIYNNSRIEKDSLIINKLHKKYFFGKFESTELQQVQGLLKKYLKIDDFDKHIILTYKDSVYGYEETAKMSNPMRSKNGLDELTMEEYLDRRESYDKRQKKCLKLATNNNAVPRYLYSENLNQRHKPKHYTNHKLPSILKRIFFNDVKGGVVILKPNGEYFYYRRVTEDFVRKMLNDDWDLYINDFNAVKSGSKNNLEFADKMNEDFENKMRKNAMNVMNRSNRGNMRNGNSRRSKLDGTMRTQRIRLKTPNCFIYGNY